MCKHLFKICVRWERALQSYRRRMWHRKGLVDAPLTIGFADMCFMAHRQRL
jgi:hypothetical protein